MKALITGAAGFIGSHLTNHLLLHTDWEVVILDKLSYAARGFDRLHEIGVFTNKRVKVLTHDLAYPMSDGLKREIGSLDYIFHLAAESHVDNSVDEPMAFVTANVVGTGVLLEYARTLWLEKFIYFSTDEVFGPAINRAFDAFDRHNPQNPYAATKSAGEQLAVAWEHTYKIPIQIVHCMNVFGERQHPEKFIPKVIKQLLEGETVEVYTDENGIVGSRFYIHADDVAKILVDIVENPTGQLKENIGGVCEIDNYEMANFIADVMDINIKVEHKSFDLGKSCHDIRYDIDPTLLAFWTTQEQMYEQLRETIKWTAAHPGWLEW